MLGDPGLELHVLTDVSDDASYDDLLLPCGPDCGLKLSIVPCVHLTLAFNDRRIRIPLVVRVRMSREGSCWSY
jgi:hypothetical protein